MSKHEKKQSVFYEPHLRENVQESCFDADPSESKAERILRKSSRSELEKLQQSVFEEVALVQQTSPSVLPEYFAWRRAQVGAIKAFALLGIICVGAGVFSFLTGILFSLMMAGFTDRVGAVGAVTIAPLVEEFAKILLPLWLIEQRPWLFRWSWEIPLVCIVGALGFATLENFAYLKLYIEDPGPAITLWRWTICTAVHVAGASISSIGVVRYWKSRFATSTPGNVASSARTVGPYLIVAIVLHAMYNLSTLVYELIP